MSDLPSNPVDAVLTLLRIGPDDNRWNLPDVRRLRAYCDQLVATNPHDNADTFTGDEIEVGRSLVASDSPPTAEPVESPEARQARLTALNQQKGLLL